MRLLLDTHTLLWVMLADQKLSRKAKEGVEDVSNEVFVSVVCIWEIATKVRIGKMPEPGDLLQEPLCSFGRSRFSRSPANPKNLLKNSNGTWGVVGQGFSPDVSDGKTRRPSGPEACSCLQKLNLRG